LIGIYVHIPFCIRKCLYCDFNSYAGLDRLQSSYAQAILEEMSLRHKSLRDSPGQPLVETIFFGGGTPTVMDPRLLLASLERARSLWETVPDAEISIEANPGTVGLDSLRRLRDGGFNRLSLGVQSFDDGLLRTLGRIHSSKDAEDAIRYSRQAGFRNLSVDIMFGLPGQTRLMFLHDLERAASYEPEHLSVYSLIIEEGTAFARLYEDGLLPLPTEDESATMYETADEFLDRAGYVHYEISNWAKRGLKTEIPSATCSDRILHWASQNHSCGDPASGYAICQHNLNYWHSGEYLGFGAGAHSYWSGVRFSNEYDPTTYIDKVARPELPVQSAETLDLKTKMSEFMFLGLRAADGPGFDEFRNRFGLDMELVFGGEIRYLLREGLIDRNESSIFLSRKGRLLGNEVFVRFV
jgi:oxygen-independent coproporphyrinogen III oxidase